MPTSLVIQLVLFVAQVGLVIWASRVNRKTKDVLADCRRTLEQIKGEPSARRGDELDKRPG